MNLKDTCNWLELHPTAVRSWLTGELGIKPSDIDPMEECSLPLMLEISGAFPKHTRVMVIKVRCSDDGAPESLEATMLGKWTGLMMRLASRKFDNLYREYIYTLRKGKQRPKQMTPPAEVETGTVGFVSGNLDTEEEESQVAETVWPADVAEPVTTEPAIEEPTIAETVAQSVIDGILPNDIHATSSSGALSFDVPKRATVLNL